MPEYRAIRSRHSFLEMCHQPDLIAEITMLPLKAFQMDAAILFSDILMIPEALKVGLHFQDKVGPVIDRPIKNRSHVDALPNIDVRDSLHFVAEGIKHFKLESKTPLIGFCGGPFTVASYMIEGGSSKDLRKTKDMMLSDPDTLHRLLDILATHSVNYLNMQIDAGVDALQIFDSWANHLAYPQFREFSLAYMDKILKGLKKDTPVILFCRGSSVFAQDLAEIKPQGISLDWNADLTRIRQMLPAGITLQGNLDPDVLLAPKSTLQKEVTRMLNGRKGDPAYIFNLGHGITPEVPYENVRTLVETVQEFS
jgi:uroporphyrinogen decarboxylase